MPTVVVSEVLEAVMEVWEVVDALHAAALRQVRPGFDTADPVKGGLMGSLASCQGW